jgi:hypothetical protein
MSIVKGKSSAGPVPIILSAEERARGAYNPETLTQVLSALHQDGLVLLKGVADVAHIDRINQEMCGEVQDILNDPKNGFNHGIKCKGVISSKCSMSLTRLNSQLPAASTCCQ